MNHSTASIETMNTSKRRAESACWPGEWSFIEEVDVALQKSVRLPIAEEQSVGNYANAGSYSEH